MAWRKWFVRLLVFTVVGSCGGGVFLYQRFTNPAAVRDQVVAKLKKHFAGAQVTVDSARLRILGGIIVSELRLARKNDPGKSEILHVPTAVFYHDKEKVLGGELVLRKVELERPRMRIERDKDGSWNVQGIGGKPQPDQPLPIVVVHQGTLEFEDRGPGGTGKLIVLTDVDLRLVNDPLDLVTIEGSATSEFTGRLHIDGQWQRHSQEISLTLKAPQISLAGIVVDRLEKLCPAGALEGLKLAGTADLKAELSYRPDSAPAFSYDAWLTVTNAKVSHPKLPLAWSEVNASIRCDNGDLRIDKLSAKSAGAELTARAAATLPFKDRNFECHAEVRHLDVRENLIKSLPVNLLKLYRLLRPSGPATIRADVARHGGAWTKLASGAPSTLQLVPEGMAITFDKFRYPLAKVAGTVDINLHTKLAQVDVTGYTGPHPIFIKGSWQGDGINADGMFDVVGNDLPLDEKVVTAFVQPNLHKLAQSFNATGKGDVKAFIRHVPGTKEFHNEYHVRFYDSSMCWDSFRYRLTKVSGYLDIYPKYWEFREGKGTHNGAEVSVEGNSLRAPAPAGVLLNITGRRVAVDGDLRKALEPIKQLGNSWDTFRPSGQLNFTAKIEQHAPTPGAAAPEDIDIHLDVQGSAVKPAFFPLAIDQIAGKFHFHKNRLEILDASARHRGTTITLGHGTVDLHPGGGHFADLTDLHAQALVIDDEFIRALPKELRAVADTLKLAAPLDVHTRLIASQAAEPGSPPDVWWDGQCWLKNAKFNTGLQWSKVTGTVASIGRCVGPKILGINGNVLLDEATLLGQPFRNAQVRFQIKDTAPEKLVLGIRGPIFGGDISGEARIDLGSTLGYELNLTGSRIDLAEFSRHNLGPKSKLQGSAMARLYLTGQGASANDLDGNGRVDIPKGRLYNLPLLLDILKFIGLRPDRTTFEELHAQFAIHGKRVAMRKLELLGNAISLTGRGEFNLDGTDVALDFYPGWARLDQLLPPAVRPLPPAVNKNLLTIQMRGKITADERDRKFTMKPIPGIVDPLMHLRNKLMGLPEPQPPDDFRILPNLGAR